MGTGYNTSLTGFSGTANIQSGVVYLRSANGLGSGSLNIGNGATLSLWTTTTTTFANPITLNGIGGTNDGYAKPAIYGDGGSGIFTLSGQITLGRHQRHRQLRRQRHDDPQRQDHRPRRLGPRKRRDRPSATRRRDHPRRIDQQRLHRRHHDQPRHRVSGENRRRHRHSRQRDHQHVDQRCHRQHDAHPQRQQPNRLDGRDELLRRLWLAVCLFRTARQHPDAGRHQRYDRRGRDRTRRGGDQHHVQQHADGQYDVGRQLLQRLSSATATTAPAAPARLPW